MQQWTLIKLEDIKDYLTVNQQKYLKKLKEISESTERVIDETISSVSLQVRSEMKGVYRGRVPRNSSSIPRSLKRTAVILILEELQARFPALGLTSDQRRLIERSRQYLERVAKGDILLEEVEIGDGTGIVVVVSRRRPKVSREVLADL